MLANFYLVLPSPAALLYQKTKKLSEQRENIFNSNSLAEKLNSQLGNGNRSILAMGRACSEAMFRGSEGEAMVWMRN